LTDRIHDGLLKREIHTYKLRGSRITNKQSEALNRYWDSYGIDPAGLLDLPSIFAPCEKMFLEIGTGMGEATVEMAQKAPEAGILAIEVHRPGIGALLAKISEKRLTNVRVIEADATSILLNHVTPESLDGIRLFFPDPWPKKRHHKRRIVQEEWLKLAISRLRSGGTLHVATDWEPYALWMQERFEANPEITGGIVARPDWRPLTKFESQGISKGHRVVDFIYTKKCGG